MSRKTGAVIVALVAAAASFFLTRVLWPDPPGMPGPPPDLLPVFIGVSIVESLAFGAGVAFLIFAYPLIRAGTTSAGLALATYLAIGWTLVNWWPHDNLHRVVGMDFPRLAGIEIGFHVTLIAAALVIAFYFVDVMRRARAAA